MDKVQKILSEIATRKLCTMDEHMAFYNDTAKEDYRFLSEIEELIKALQEEPVSEDLEEEIDNYVKRNGYDGLDSIEEVKYIANHFAKWQKEQMTTKAIDGKVIANGMGNPILHLWDKGRHLIGKKAKVIVIEEE